MVYGILLELYDNNNNIFLRNNTYYYNINKQK